jgi:hypothetical protein
LGRMKRNAEMPGNMARLLRPEIAYFVVIPEDDPEHASPFQGFSFGITETRDILRSLVAFPADVIEPALPMAAQAARRVNGTGAWHWNPLALYALDRLTVPAGRPFWVMMTSDADVADAVDAWASQQEFRPLHVSEISGSGRIPLWELDQATMQAHFAAIFSQVAAREPDLEMRLVAEALAAWKPRASRPFSRSVPPHNVTIPNLMALTGAGFHLDEASEPLAVDPDDYQREICALAHAVLDIRETAYKAAAHRTTPPQPDLYIMAPSFYAYVYESGLALPSGKAGMPARNLLQMMRRQTGYQFKGAGKTWLAILEDPLALALLDMRRRELDFQVVAAGLAAAGTMSATIRLPAAVNRVQGSIRQIAAHVRSGKGGHARKLVKLLAEAQARLITEIGPQLLSVIERSQTGVKLVTDVPLEWLPIRGLPLMLRKNVSRITTTPGNLMTGELARSELIHLDRDAFREILIVSAIDPGDPISEILIDMVAAWAPSYGDQIHIRIVRARSRTELIAALNDFQGAVMVFDGHGGHDEVDGVAVLRVGKDDVSVWDLRSQIRVPPIVILSACDTQAADRSHATTANAFLTAGAVTVLGSLLPVGARDSAMLIARLIWRLAEFLPAITGEDGRAVLWSEVMGGMLRLHLLLDLLQPLIERGAITTGQYSEINMAAIVATANQDEEWWEGALRRLGAVLDTSDEAMEAIGRATIATSDAIRYVQIGNPELIVIKSRALLRAAGYDVPERKESGGTGDRSRTGSTGSPSVTLSGAK